MKILMISSSSGSRGGGEIYLRTLASVLRLWGVEVVIAMSNHRQMDELAEDCARLGLTVRRFEYLNTYHRRFRSVGAFLDSSQSKVVRRLIEDTRPDLVHLNLQTVEDGLDLLKGSATARIPAVVTVHQTSSMHRLDACGGRLRDCFSRCRFHRSGSPTIAVSKASGASLSNFLSSALQTVDPTVDPEIGGVASSRLVTFIVPNGVAEPTVLPSHVVRTAWGIPNNAVVLGCLARIEYEKNPLFIVPLLRRLPSHTHFVWIGDGRMRDDLKQLARKEQLCERIHITGWEKDASRLLSGLDVFLLPSLYEGLSLALLEAMAAGLPCVVSEIDGTREAIQNGTSGYLCHVSDLEAWQTTLEPLIASAELRQKVGQAAKDQHEAHFSIESMARRTLAVYKHVIRDFET